MAVLTPSVSTGPFEVPALGQYKLAAYTVTLSNQSATDEWIATGGSEILHAFVPNTNRGTAGIVANASVVINASGTGVAAGANPGNLGIESADTTDATFDILVIYR